MRHVAGAAGPWGHPSEPACTLLHCCTAWARPPAPTAPHPLPASASPQAITAWRDTSDYGRCQLVKGLLVAAGGFSDPELVTGVPLGGSAQGPLQQVQAWAERLMGGGGDPFFAVVATKL